MKKFVIFALAVLVAFAMCSCQPTTEGLNDGMVDFKVYTNAQASKALSIVQDLGADEVEKIQLAFIPSEQVTDHINCQYKIGTATTVNNAQSSSDSALNWIDDLITWDKTNNKATWNEDAQLYLSQGKWTIYARAVDGATTPNPLYEGKESTFANKKSAYAKITLIPVASDAIGTLTIESLKASKVFEDPTKEQLVYSITGITGKSSVSDTVLDALADQTGAPTGQYLFESKKDIELKQGSYILSVRLQQDTRADGATSAVWTDYTGGSVIDFGIYKDKETIIGGDVEASDYMATTVGVEIENAIFTLTLSEDTATGSVTGGKYTPKYTATITVDSNTPKAKTLNIMWYVDGQLRRTQPLNGALTDTLETLEVAHGKHNIQAIVTGSITGGTAVDAKSNLASKVLDTRSKL